MNNLPSKRRRWKPATITVEVAGRRHTVNGRRAEFLAILLDRGRATAADMVGVRVANIVLELRHKDGLPIATDMEPNRRGDAEHAVYSLAAPARAIDWQPGART